MLTFSEGINKRRLSTCLSLEIFKLSMATVSKIHE
jgi:hypothetical protein